jgi:hypothetical protein
MKFQMSQPIESTSQLSPDGQPNEPTENMAVPSPAKAHAHEMHAGSQYSAFENKDGRLSSEPGR